MRSRLLLKTEISIKKLRQRNFAFLDSMLYCAPGTSLKSFINAYVKDGTGKFYFPYARYTSKEFLKVLTNTLTSDDFYSDLKKLNTLDDDENLKKNYQKISKKKDQKKKDEEKRDKFYKFMKEEYARLGLNHDQKVIENLYNDPEERIRITVR